MPDPSVTRVATARIPTRYGEFQLGYYNNTEDDKDHLAFYMGDFSPGETPGEPHEGSLNGAHPDESRAAEDVLVRVHSECLTGDIFGSLRCDCGEQLDRSLQLIAEEGRGVVVYLRQEGRGIGLLQKLHAYNLQDDGHDTVDANLLLGHEADGRSYTLAARILEDLGVRSVRLITNNPKKISSLEADGIQVNGRIELPTSVTPENSRYLLTKAERMNHLLRVSNPTVQKSESDEVKTQPAD